MSDPTTRYATAVVAREVVAGPWVRLACERHLRDLDEAPTRGYRFEPEAAAHVFAFFDQFLRIPDGADAGKPFTLEPFQQFLVGSLYGWLDETTGYRRFRVGYVELGKGNGKSPMGAGLCLYSLVADGERGAEVYTAAVSRDQAVISYRDAKRMAEASPELARALQIYRSSYTMVYHAGGDSFLRALSSEGGMQSGIRPHFALLDEVHEHRTAEVVDKLRAGTKARRQALIIEITNSGFDRKSVCWAHHEYTRQILESAIPNDRWFGYIASLDEGEDPFEDRACWVKANPGLGAILPEAYLEEQLEEARGMPSKRNIVMRLNFCVWTEQATRWIDLDVWDRNDAEVVEEELAGRPCFAGLDMSSTTDLTALVLVFPPPEDDPEGRLSVVPRIWCPAESIVRRSRRDGVPYDQWAAEGHLIATEGDVVDYDAVRAEVNDLGSSFDVREIAIDRWNSTQLQTQLLGDGFEVVKFGQGFASMSTPTRELERLLLAGRLAHGGHPVLRWMATNVSVTQDPAGNIKPDKAKSGERIDGIVALIMAVGRWAVAPSAEESNLYDEREVVLL